MLVDDYPGTKEPQSAIYTHGGAGSGGWCRFWLEKHARYSQQELKSWRSYRIAIQATINHWIRNSAWEGNQTLPQGRRWGKPVVEKNRHIIDFLVIPRSRIIVDGSREAADGDKLYFSAGIVILTTMWGKIMERRSSKEISIVDLQDPGGHLTDLEVTFLAVGQMPNMDCTSSLRSLELSKSGTFPRQEVDCRTTSKEISK
ncbi:hypothetical protein BJX64DRAFT_200051 [Aspergillus heterothallicus]